jgi:hypothetical protein
MDRDTFVRKAAKRSGFTVEEYPTFFDITPCECGKKKCKGWRVRWKFGAERRREASSKPYTPPPPPRPGFVYFARLGDLIKIGISKRPEERAYALNAELLVTLDGDTDLERSFHEEFADLRERNEWFRAEPRLLERIEALAK